jgi:DNA-binding transcriptional MerR regulator
MEQTVKRHISKCRYRIGDLAKELKLKKFVIRFWEKEFGLKADRTTGGQRFYSKDDFTVFAAIKNLLYAQGFTIAGAKQQLRQQHIVRGDGRPGISPATTTDSFEEAKPLKSKPAPTESSTTPNKPPPTHHELAKIKKKLLEIKAKLS